MDDLVRNDDALHDLLELSIGEPPQTSVSIAMARSRGQRRRRWRRRYAPGLAAVAAAAAIVLVAVGLPFTARAGHSAHGHVATAAGQLVARPPSRFSLSTPYASFGWLPAGFSATGSKVLGDPDDQSAQGESIWASNQQPDGKTLNLQVNSASSCQLTRSSRQLATTPPRALTLECAGNEASWGPVVSRAPDVRGGLAYWDQHGDLLWKYGPDAWAQVQPASELIEPHLDPEFDGWYNVPGRLTCRSRGHSCSTAALQYALDHPAYRQSATTRALLLRVAASVHYGRQIGQVYGFTIRDVPASWRAAAIPVSFAYASGGQIVNTSWQAGPASDTQGLSISVGPAAGSCKMFPGQSQYVTVDGIQAALRTMGLTGKHNQTLCIPNLDGLAVDIYLDLTVPGTNSTPLPDSAGFGSAVAVFGHLRLLGPNPAHWTPRPLG
jgi:hypothetical protein